LKQTPTLPAHPHLREQVEPLPLEGAAQQRGVWLRQLGIGPCGQALGLLGDALRL